MRRRSTFTAVAIIAASLAAVAATTTSAGASIPVPSLSKIAYSNFDARDAGSDVMVANSDGSKVANITHDGTATRYSTPNWSPNGLMVAYSAYRTNGKADVMVALANGKSPFVISGPSSSTSVQSIHPTWSPDGSVVFASNRDGNFDLYRASLLTTVITRLTKTQAPTQNLSPDFSPSGDLLAFSRTVLSSSIGSRTTALYTMKAYPGAKAIQLTKAYGVLGDRGAAWSPDGNRIAFYSDRTGNQELYVMNSAGGGLTQVTFNRASDSQPTWSPNGTQIIFVSDRTGNTELYGATLNGASPIPTVWQITFDKAAKGGPDFQMSLSPQLQ